MSKIYLDDLRPLPDGYDVLLRSTEEAKTYIKEHGIPSHISFDHDLGGDDTSMVFLHWLINEVLDGNAAFPPHFTFNVHSANPVGAANITGLLSSFLSCTRDSSSF